jgi:hypothetical protein
MTIKITPQCRVHCEAHVALPLPIHTAWGQLRDFHRFASQDYFHAHIDVEGGIPRAGAALSILHRFAGFKTIRRGRILRWRENEGYAFSDLSLAGNRCGFPHVLELKLETGSAANCRLKIITRGPWTAPTPRWMAWLWLYWVFGHVTRSIENQLLGFVAFRLRSVENQALTKPDVYRS